MQPEQNNDSATVIDTSEVSMEHSESTENTMAQNGSSIKKKKNGKTGIILGFTLLFLLAAGGVGFGIWAMMDGNAQREKLNAQIDTLRKQNGEVVEEEDERDDNNHDGDVEEVAKIDKYLASNLISPYIGYITIWTNIFDYEFNDDLKVKVSAINLSSDYGEGRYTSSNDEYYYQVGYFALNNLFKKLFGGDLIKKDYSLENGKMSFTYSGQYDEFIVRPYEGGGTGGEQFSVVKDAYYSEKDLIVEVYHDVANWCGDGEQNDPCLIRGEMTAEEYVEKYNSIIPVYKMYFSRDNNRYILRGIEKA